MIPHIKPSSFIDSYMRYMSAQETPAWYDFICANWILSTTLGRDVIVDRPRAPVHLNMYVILVSESGIMRKSSSIRIATSLVRSFLEAEQSHMLLIENRISQGLILNELTRATREHGSGQAVIVASELAAVLGRGSSTAGMPALLTDLYDCPDKRDGGGSLRTGGFRFSDAYVSFIAGSTPSWLARTVRPEIIEGGFTSRCFFVQGKARKRLVPWPEDVDDSDARAKLVTQLQELKHGSAHWSRIGINNSAKRSFSEWYSRRDIHRDVYRESFESREDAHVLRFAGLAAINEQVWEISDDHIRRSIGIVSDLKKFGAEMFTSELKGRSDTKLLKRIRERILAAGDVGIGKRELYRSLSIAGRQADEFRTLLKTMHELDLVKEYSITGKDTGGRDKTLYVATEYLRNEQFLDDVTQKLGV